METEAEQLFQSGADKKEKGLYEVSPPPIPFNLYSDTN